MYSNINFKFDLYRLMLKHLKKKLYEEMKYFKDHPIITFKTAQKEDTIYHFNLDCYFMFYSYIVQMFGIQPPFSSF